MKEAFGTAERGIQVTNPSVDDRALIATLEQHGAEEGEVLARSEALAQDVRSPTVRYLVEFILEDERRHHRIVEELANSIAWDGCERDGEVAKVPDLGPRGETSDFMAETRRLLAIEKQDRRELRRLRKQLHNDNYDDTTVWALLVDTMIVDTGKHMRILRFLLNHVTAD